MALSLILFIGAAVVGYAIGYVGDSQTQQDRTANEKRAEEVEDRKEEPFTATVEYDDSPPEVWKIVLDRTLTEAEQKRLSAFRVSEEARKYLTSLGGRTIRYTSLLNSDPMDLVPQAGGNSTVFKMNLFSKRDTQLSITDLKAVDVSCREPTAKAVIVFPPQGGAAYEGILYNLAKPDLGPIITDEKYQGEHYFSRRKINLGGGESPGGLRVEAVTQRQSCTWELEAHYRDAYQNFGTVRLRHGDKPFYAEGIPARPQQLWYMNIGAQAGEDMWLSCGDDTEDPFCQS
ncbi:hypothetical protein ACGRHY_19790 [Streptomyces sp. HK10]|uniref:hypothetical protein n=1 Tax=Streptomyces sp. HK10 TaxID=3373255 RepID=UPI00374A12DA